MVNSLGPILAVADVAATLDYYKNLLGFPNTWAYGDPPGFGGAEWGAATVMFGLNPEGAAHPEGQSIWVNVEVVDEIHAFHSEKGANIVEPIEDKPWGRREYTVNDLNGYRLRFAGIPPSSAPPSDPFPEGVSIHRRLPTLEEYRAIAGKEFYQGEAALEPFSNTWAGVVAEGPDGRAIGTVRIMYDAPGWFSIWDVAVLPEWQGKHIGNEMMKEALQTISAHSPGAWVVLFTYKDGFYEKLGFSKGSVTIRRA